MNNRNYVAIVLLTTAVLFTATIFNSGALSQNQKNLIPPLPLDSKEGHFLYTPWYSKTTYLINETHELYRIDTQGKPVKRWGDPTFPAGVDSPEMIPPCASTDIH